MRSPRSFLAVIAGSVSVVVILVGATTPVMGATSSVDGGNGLKVSPVTTNITINPGQSQVIQINVQNVTKSTVELQALVNDFVAGSSETGAPALLLNPGDFAPSHSLKRYVAPISNITLAAGEQKTVAVTITIPKNAPGGGYYGAVRFAQAQSTENSGNVSLSASVGSLILVRVPGDFKEQLLLSSFDIRSNDDVPKVIFVTGNGLDAVARFRNTGDVQEQPFGKVLLKQGDKQLAAYELNNTTPRGNVLPDSVRKFTVHLDKVGAFGQYTVYGNFGYGTSGQLLSGKTTFYVIPLGLILTVLALIVLIVFAIFGMPRLVRAYNRRILSQASRR